MVISITQNHNRTPEPMAETITPLQECEAALALQGTKLPEEKRVDTLELHVDTLKPQVDENAAPRVQGQAIMVVVLKSYYYLDNIDQYLGKFEQYAKGEIDEYDYIGYTTGFEREMSSALGYSYGGWKFVDNLVDEMKYNLENGIANTLDNLKTKFTVGKGLTEVTYKEMLDIGKTGNFLKSILPGDSPLGYDDYMRMGFARAYVYKPELNLTDSQREVLSQAVERQINVRLENNKYWVERAASEKQNARWEGYYIGGQIAVASNAQIISGIMKAFSEYDPQDKNSFRRAVDKCQELMRPWSERCAGYIATQCPGYASSYVQEKANLSRNFYLSLWEGKLL